MGPSFAFFFSCGGPLLKERILSLFTLVAVVMGGGAGVHSKGI